MNTTTLSPVHGSVTQPRRVERLITGQATSDGAGVKLTRVLTHDLQYGQGLLPSNRLTQALNYARVRREALQVFLGDPDMAPDTNHLERALRVIPMGRRNWLFCWSEVGAEIVGIVQSLIVTCKLHDIDPATYLTDVLQRVGRS